MVMAAQKYTTIFGISGQTFQNEAKNLEHAHTHINVEHTTKLKNSFGKIWSQH